MPKKSHLLALCILTMLLTMACETAKKEGFEAVNNLVNEAEKIKTEVVTTVNEAEQAKESVENAVSAVDKAKEDLKAVTN